jgi:uncharacterized protein (DUF58 family)
MLSQSDSTALTLFAETVTKYIPPHSKRTHLNIILKTLQQNKAAGQTNLAGVLHTIAETTKRRGIVILISDLLDDEDDIFKGLAHLKFLKHDVIVFQTMDHQELNLDYEGLIQFEDLESKAKIRTFPHSLRESYRQRVADLSPIPERRLPSARSRIPGRDRKDHRQHRHRLLPARYVRAVG